MIRRLTVFFLALAFTFCSVGLAQIPKKHHRVLEIEKNLYQEIQTTLRDLIPGQPFYLKVVIDPLHRQTSTVNSKENLPYYETEEEIKDEWDDPLRTDFELLSRVNRISVKATLSDSLSKEQLPEVKQAISNRILFVEGRDLIEIETRSWPTAKDHSSYTSWILTIGVVLLLLLGVVYFVVSSVSVARISRAIKSIKVSAGDFGGGASLGAQQVSGAAASATAPSSSKEFGSSSQVQINDTIRMTEVIIGLIKGFEDSKSFPSLEDMILIDQFFDRHPRSTGALVAEFPKDLKEHLFAMSSSQSWLEGLTNPGDLDSVSFELMNRLMRTQRDSSLTQWNHFLILCWRLGQLLPQFLKRIEPEDRLTILRALPQSLAIEVAREAMPGEWAAVLKRAKVFEVLNPKKLEAYEKICLELSALKSFSHLEQYKKDTDLIRYLRIVDPNLEREIYGASGELSNLNLLRPPFYPFFELTPQELKSFAPQVTLEDWSLALMNIPKKERLQVESTFSDKQKFHLLELIKRNDRMSLNAEVIGLSRERIGRQLSDFKKTELTKEKQSQTTSSTSSSDSSEAA